MVLSRAYRCATIALGLASPAAAQLQALPNITDALQLPRPGYEQRTARIGGGTLATSLALGLRRDDNIFATDSGAVTDEIVMIEPRLVLDTGRDLFRFNAELFGDLRQYIRNGGESQNNFGARISGQWLPLSRWQFSGRGIAQRFVQSRNDPEAASNLGLPPRRINIFSGEVAARYTVGRLGVGLSGRVDRNDFLPPEDADRTLTSFHASMRLSVAPSTGVAFFVEPYVTRRNHDRAVDRSGIDRDATTAGALAGVRFNLTSTLDGEVGIGGFRAAPDDPTLRAFSGVAANVDLRWTPQRRTAITARALSGDVATVVAGAIGRTDTFIGLQIDQEARHNLLLQLQVSWRESVFRGTGIRFATTGIEGSAEYLVTRALALVVEYSHARRTADLPFDRFRRNYVGVAMRWRH